MSELVQEIYSREHQGVRATFGNDSQNALAYYSDLVAFIQALNPSGHAGQQVRLLDVGCGSGWSTYALSLAGFDATGVDLNQHGFEPPVGIGCHLTEGSAMALPFEADAFDIVVCYQCLEHVPDPRLALDEMIRVCRPDGQIAIVGPNLVSPMLGLRFLAQPRLWYWPSLTNNKKRPHHPYGNTVFEILGISILRTFQLLRKMIRRSPEFLMRVPDSTPPFHADNDACYLCNPTDLIRYFQQRGLRIERKSKPGRNAMTWFLAGGTWIAARKQTGN